jgi:hypothetical protein
MGSVNFKDSNIAIAKNIAADRLAGLHSPPAQYSKQNDQKNFIEELTTELLAEVDNRIQKNSGADKIEVLEKVGAEFQTAKGNGQDFGIKTAHNIVINNIVEVLSTLEKSKAGSKESRLAAAK